MTRPLELYVHIPFCVKKCNYCDFLSFPADEQMQSRYVEALIRQIMSSSKQFKDYLVTSIYIGGGTPSWLNQEHMLRILDALMTSFCVSEDAEISMECNPGTMTRGKLEAYRLSGVNRLSIGLQSAENEELKLLGRVHTYEQFLKTYEMARNAGYGNINVDLMSCLPYQTAEKFSKTLSKVIRLKPEHISAYTLIIEKGTPFYEEYRFDAVKQEAGMPTEVLPTEEECYQIYKMTQEMLIQAGYEQYETSNYAKPGFACEHNIGYWTRAEYLGLGLGAASLINNVRYTNTTDIYKYISGEEIIAKEEPVERKAQMEEFMFLGLRMKQGVTRKAFEDAFHVSVESIYKDVIDELRGEELLEIAGGRLFLTEKGSDLANYVMAKFLL